jgi:transposase
MAKVRGTYPPAFDLRALAMTADPPLRVAAVARRLGTSESRRHEWTNAVRANRADAFPGSGRQTPSEEENRRRRAENTRLGVERDRLRTATAFFPTLAK